MNISGRPACVSLELNPTDFLWGREMKPILKVPKDAADLSGSKTQSVPILPW